MRKLLIILLIPFACKAQWNVPQDFTLSEAINNTTNQIEGGDTVYINPGIYEPIKCTYKFPSEVFFVGKDGMQIRGSIEHDANPDVRGLVWIAGAENITFINWHLHGGNPWRDTRSDEYTGISNGFDLMSGNNINIYESIIENTGGSGVYLASSCKNVNIKRNIFKYNGYYSESLNRFGHRNLYIQSWEDSYCNIEDNLLYKGMNYGIQIWHQDGKTVNGIQVPSKLVGVHFKNNIVISLRETALHYGGYNKAYGGRINDNSIYYLGSGAGIRVGYTTHADQNMNHDFEVKNNVVQNSGVRIVNPRNYKGTDEIYVNNNQIEKDLLIEVWQPVEINDIIGKWDYNRIGGKFQWTAYANPTGTKVEQVFNQSVSVSGAYDWGLPETNTNTTLENSYKIIDQGNRKILAVHNFEEKDGIDLDVEGNVKIVDFENGQTVYQGPGSEANVITTLTDTEPIYANDIPTPDKTGKDYGVFVIYQQDNPPPPPVVIPSYSVYLTKEHFDSRINELMNMIDDLSLNVEMESGKNLSEIYKNRDEIKQNGAKITNHKVEVEVKE